MSVDFDQMTKDCLDAFAATGAGSGSGAVEAYSSAVSGAVLPPPRGDFRNQAVEVDGGGEVSVRSREFMLGVRLAEFPAGLEPEQDDTVTIGGVAYVVIDVDDNGAGHAWLHLHKT